MKSIQAKRLVYLFPVVILLILLKPSFWHCTYIGPSVSEGVFVSLGTLRTNWQSNTGSGGISTISCWRISSSTWLMRESKRTWRNMVNWAKLCFVKCQVLYTPIWSGYGIVCWFLISKLYPTVTLMITLTIPTSKLNPNPQPCKLTTGKLDCIDRIFQDIVTTNLQNPDFSLCIIVLQSGL